MKSVGIIIELEDYASNFKKISVTNSGNSLIKDETIKLYNFDAIKDEIATQIGVKNICKSCDGLLINENENIIFEFKYQNYTTLEKQEEGKINIYGNQNTRKNDLKMKAFDSKGLLNILRNNKIIHSEQDTLYVIYKSGKDKSVNKTLEKNQVEELSPEITKRFQMIGRKSNKRFIAFGLEKMQGKLYDKIYTYNKQEFMEQFFKQPQNLEEGEELASKI